MGACLLLSLACGSADAWSSASSDPSCDGSTIVLELEEEQAAAAATSPSSPMPTSTSEGRLTFYSLLGLGLLIGAVILIKVLG